MGSQKVGHNLAIEQQREKEKLRQREVTKVPGITQLV